MNADIPGRLFEVQPDDIVIAVLPLFHVFGLSTILNVCVRFGCTMSLVPRFNPAAMLTAIQRDRATIFEGVPTMFVDLLARPELDATTCPRCGSRSPAGRRFPRRSLTRSRAASGW